MFLVVRYYRPTSCNYTRWLSPSDDGGPWTSEAVSAGINCGRVLAKLYTWSVDLLFAKEFP